MRANDIAERAKEVLDFLDQMELDGSAKIAILESASGVLKSVQSAEATQQLLAASISNMLNRKL